MKIKSFTTATLVCTVLLSSNTKAAGFKEITVEDTGYPKLTVGLWYPSDTANAKEVNTKYGMSLALNAPINQTNGALILISHGYGGWYAGHADTAVALADAGYIVAAPSHTGNTWSDMSSPPDQWLIDRPRHISKVIDHLIHDRQISTHIDIEKIGMYGFSAGGYTAVGLLGGVPDIDHASAHCHENPNEYVCTEGLIDAMSGAGMQTLPKGVWGADQRIQAASIAAPAGAFIYTRSSLKNVSADVQLWSAELDQSVPTSTNAAVLATRLPQSPETHWVKNANHFAFLTVPCRETFKQEDPDEYKLVCEDQSKFDRYEFHDAMHEQMIRFFDDKLKIGRR